MEALAAIRQQLNDSERRVADQDRDLRALRRDFGETEKTIVGFAHDIEDIRDDIAAVQGQLKWVLRGIGLTVLTLLTTGTGIIVAILSQHG